MQQRYSFPNPVPTSIAALNIVLLVIIHLSGNATGQSRDNRGKNNPFSPSPAGQRPTQPQPAERNGSSPIPAAYAVRSTGEIDNPGLLTVDRRILGIAKTEAAASRLPSETYKVDIGDVLFVRLKNSTGSEGYYTVRTDGTIDFPLAGENVVVVDQTIERIEKRLASGITLYPDPGVEVKVREYASHTITVKGLVASPGIKCLQREAMPIFVIRADVDVDPKATKAVITRRTGLKSDSYDLLNSDTDNILVYPGDAIEFTSEGGTHTGYYYITGETVSTGQRDLVSGLTLFQAVIAAGGGKNDAKKAIIRRKNENGVFAGSEYSLRAIKHGKAPDPALAPGDVVEVQN